MEWCWQSEEHLQRSIEICSFNPRFHPGPHDVWTPRGGDAGRFSGERCTGGLLRGSPEGVSWGGLLRGSPEGGLLARIDLKPDYQSFISQIFFKYCFISKSVPDALHKAVQVSVYFPSRPIIQLNEVIMAVCQKHAFCMAATWHIGL